MRFQSEHSPVSLACTEKVSFIRIDIILLKSTFSQLFMADVFSWFSSELFRITRKSWRNIIISSVLSKTNYELSWLTSSNHIYCYTGFKNIHTNVITPRQYLDTIQLVIDHVQWFVHVTCIILLNLWIRLIVSIQLCVHGSLTIISDERTSFEKYVINLKLKFLNRNDRFYEA